MKHVSHDIVIDAPVQHVYRAYTDYNRLDSKMDELQDVNVEGSEYNKMNWKVDAIGGLKLEWQARVIRQVANEVIEWGEVEDSLIKTNGHVRFTALDADRTKVSVDCHYTVPGGDVVADIGALLANPEKLLISNLEEFKKSCESSSPTARQVVHPSMSI